MLNLTGRLRDLPPGTYKIRGSIEADGCIRVAAGQIDAVIEAVTVCPVTDEPHRWRRDGIFDTWSCPDCWAEDRP